MVLQRTIPSSSLQHRIPLQVLGSRMIAKRGGQVHQVLIQWSGLDRELSTWEDHDALKQMFPAAPAWGQAGTQAGGDVSTHIVEDSNKLGPRQSTQPKQPNPKYSGPEWRTG
jgi:hypothetical protein